MKNHFFLRPKSSPTIKILSGILLAILVVGCAKDRTLDEYGQDRLNQNLAHFRAIEGTWVGTGTNQQTGAGIDAISLELKASMNAKPSSDGYTTSAQATMHGTVSIGDRSASAPISNVVYLNSENADSGTFAADVTISNMNGPGNTGLMQIQGNISGDTFTGQIYSSTSSVYTISFTAHRSTQAVGQSLSTGAPSPLTDIRTFVGSYAEQGIPVGPLPGKSKAKDPQGPKVQTTMVIQNLPATPDERFYDYFGFSTEVRITLDVLHTDTGNGFLTIFNSVKMQRQGNWATFTATSSEGNVTLACSQTALPQWSCIYTPGRGSPQKILMSEQK
jgi:hypothetical protein